MSQQQLSPSDCKAAAQTAVANLICGHFLVLPHVEDQSKYDQLLVSFFEAEQPSDAVERELVAKMVRHTWLSERFGRYQDACVLITPPTPEQAAANRHSATTVPDLALYIRAQAHHDRAYARAAAELAKRRKDKAAERRGFVSQKRQKAAEQRREHRQEQQNELHNFRIAAAQICAQREMHRFVKENPGANPFGPSEKAA